MATPMGPKDMKRMDRWALESAARVAYRLLKGTRFKMLDVSFSNTPEPFALIFAFGPRADELRAAFRATSARHAPKEAS